MARGLPPDRRIVAMIGSESRCLICGCEGTVMRKRTTMLMAMTMILGGCTARSISNSDYPPDTAYRHNGYPMDANGYRGEIDDFSILVPDDSEAITDQRIAAALAGSHLVQAELGKPLLVVQSGAIAPDGEMIAALQRHFPVIPFNGQPPISDQGRENGAGGTEINLTASNVAARVTESGPAPASYARRLRLAAAEGGASRILVYWGVLETAQRGQPTELVSWVPVVGWVLPDQSQQMRIRLKAALIDTASGHWRMLTPEPIDDSSLSSPLTRRVADQDQVAQLKHQGYLALANQLAATAQ
jgi:hypothetical protein